MSGGRTEVGKLWIWRNHGVKGACSDFPVTYACYLSMEKSLKTCKPQFLQAYYGSST